jgi:hypothetical protein
MINDDHAGKFQGSRMYAIQDGIGESKAVLPPSHGVCLVAARTIQDPHSSCSTTAVPRVLASIL